MRKLLCLVVGCVIVLCTVPALAQDTTGRMLVRTSDAETVPLPGVTVTIASPSLIGGARTIITDAKGEALFLTLAPGTYEARAELHGFATQERQEVWVRLGSVTALMVTMLEATFEGEIVVLDETPVIDPMQVGTEQVFDAEYIEKTAIGTWQRFVFSPGTQTPGVDGQDILGSSSTENTWFLDGIEVTEENLGQQGRWGVATYGIDAYEEIQVKTGGYEAEYGRALGGVTSIVMKSGGNAFSGSLDTRYQADAFQEGGDHFDPDLQDKSNLAIEATIGGPILRDRLWFFAAYYHGEAEITPDGAPTTFKGTVDSPKAKLTWQISPGWRGVASVFAQDTHFDDDASSRWTMPEATYYVDTSPTYLSLGVDGMLNEAMLWTLRTGYNRRTYDSGPMSGDLETIAHINIDTNIRSENAPNEQHNANERFQASTDLTWFLSGSGGSHEIKAGVETSDISASVNGCLTGTPGGVGCAAGVSGYVFYDILMGGDDFPYGMEELVSSERGEAHGSLWSGYIQDAWRPRPNLTVKAGLRFDSVTYENDSTGASTTLERWQPRLGVAWDIGGNASNVVRASAGRYMDQATMNLAYFAGRADPTYQWASCSSWAPGLGIDPSMCSAAMTSFGIPWREDPEGWDPYGWFLADAYGGGANAYDPDLEAAYSDQFILSYERALWPRSSLELSYVNKRTRSLFEDTCNGNIPEPSQGAPCEFGVMTNLPQLKQDYSALIVQLESRTLDWLTVLASYTLSDSKGNASFLGRQYDFDYYPWHWENRYGYLDTHHRHDIKINGYALLPLDFTIAVNAGWRSAFRWTPQFNQHDIDGMPYGSYFTEPRGSQEGASDTWLDLQFTKGFRIGPTQLDLIVSVLNVLSREEVTWVCEEVTGCGDFELGEAMDWNTPRAWEVGFRLTF
jgi:hypothetical protein